MERRGLIRLFLAITLGYVLRIELQDGYGRIAILLLVARILVPSHAAAAAPFLGEGIRAPECVCLVEFRGR